ncbi:ribosomal protein S18-alanine N-acetyltransferase [Psychrobacter sp. I-STPA6b]|uniref:ribosomal protein S18-alanine N-acetyltransferase n=1 Tax=Psychrobacter sp. I-STPA6b TaxID=2585718 RepID=UPI001D0CAFA3|nr:ribosomal protein S18-alanine N-acetyltransferase [Psychrobacter sp. I-STPA6b]
MIIKNIKQLNTDELMQVCQQIAEIELEVQPIDAWSASLILETLREAMNHGVVIYKDQQIVCYCLYNYLFETAEILRIGTKPYYQRKGLASQLLVQIKHKLQVVSVERLLLEVREDNSGALALYHNLGFKEIHRRKGYYQSALTKGVDAIVMQCCL